MKELISLMSDLEPPSDHPVSASSVPQTPSAPPTPAPSGSSLPSQGYSGVSRRTHRKSRTGCSTCKARKIKCDERHPACLNCISHGVACPFLKSGVGVNRAARSSKAKSRSPISPANASTPQPGPAMIPPEGGNLPLLELELLHNFTTKTYKTLTTDPSVWEFWRDDVVQLGLSCDYIMRAVLAVSALHLAYHRPERRDFYPSPPRRSNPDGTFFIGESGVPDWAFLLSGGKSIMDILGEPGMDTVAGPFLHYGAVRWHARCAIIEQQQKPKNRTLPSPNPILAPSLELALVVRQDPSAPRDVLDAMVWLWMVSDSFVPLLKMARPRSKTKTKTKSKAENMETLVALYNAGAPWFTKDVIKAIHMRLQEIRQSGTAGKITLPGLLGRSRTETIIPNPEVLFIRAECHAPDCECDLYHHDMHVVYHQTITFHPPDHMLQALTNAYTKGGSTTPVPFIPFGLTHGSVLVDPATAKPIGHTVGITRYILGDATTTWRFGLGHQFLLQLADLHRQGKLSRTVDKIVGLGLGSLAAPWREGAEPDMRYILEEGARSATQHALVATMREFFAAKSGGKGVRGVVQDPAYIETDGVALGEELGLEKVENPEGFLELDRNSVLVCVAPDFPARQVVADLGVKPAVIIWGESCQKVDDEEFMRAMGEYEVVKRRFEKEKPIPFVDTGSPRVTRMLDEYEIVSFLWNEHFNPDTTMYIRKNVN
ncbi:hypothetical protein N0V88_008170 [Collariella sp. IMI 366227]|nr:hypothetical protein N0V88_008170 [Collariella sp. IMI 366227]